MGVCLGRNLFAILLNEAGASHLKFFKFYTHLFHFGDDGGAPLCILRRDLAKGQASILLDELHSQDSHLSPNLQVWILK